MEIGELKPLDGRCEMVEKSARTRSLFFSRVIDEGTWMDVWMDGAVLMRCYHVYRNGCGSESHDSHLHVLISTEGCEWGPHFF